MLTEYKNTCQDGWMGVMFMPCSYLNSSYQVARFISLSNSFSKYDQIKTLLI